MSQSGSYTSGGGGGGSVNTLTGNTGGAVSPTGGNINVVGSGTISVAGNPGTSTLTISSSGGSSTTYDADSGSATPSSGILHVNGGSNINTSGATNVLTVNLDNTVSISGSMTAGTGFTATTGDVAISAGNLDLPPLGGGGTQGVITVAATPAFFLFNNGTYVGFDAGNFTTAGSSNVAIGLNTMPSLNGGANNTAIGTDVLFELTSGSFNTGLGIGALGGLVSGANNIGLGHNAGAIYLSSESNNICIGTLGVTGDNFHIRIGDPAVHTSAFMAGAYGVTPAMSPQMMTIGSDGELGSQAIPGGGGIGTLDGDSGSATGATVTIAGGSNINTSAAGSTVTVNLDSTVSISGSMTAGTGFTATTGDVAISAGNLDLPATNAGATQGSIFLNSVRFLSSDGITGTGVCLGNNAGNPTVDMGSSVAIGNIALANMNGGGDSNVAVGTNALTTLTSGSTNTAVGFNALLNLATGNFNIGLGDNAGNSYTGSETGNIAIGTAGVTGDNDVMRLGDTGVITSTFVAGIYGVTPAMSPQMATIGSDGQMGSQALPMGTFTWSEITGSTVSMVVGNGYILNNAGGVTAILPSTAAVGTVFRIAGKGSGGWTISQNPGQSIQFGNQATTTSSGTITPEALPDDQYAALEVLCIVADTGFEVISSVGNFTIS